MLFADLCPHFSEPHSYLSYQVPLYGLNVIDSQFLICPFSLSNPGLLASHGFRAHALLSFVFQKWTHVYQQLSKHHFRTCWVLCFDICILVCLCSPVHLVTNRIHHITCLVHVYNKAFTKSAFSLKREIQ